MAALYRLDRANMASSAKRAGSRPRPGGDQICRRPPQVVRRCPDQMVTEHRGRGLGQGTAAGGLGELGDLTMGYLEIDGDPVAT